MQLYESERLYLLWIIAGVLVLFFIAKKRKDSLLRLFGESGTLGELMKSHSAEKLFWKSFILIASLIFIVVALAQPQWGLEKKQAKRKGVDIIFMVDTSLSMLAQDVKPDRIGKAKFLMKTFLKQLKGDRIGIVTFAGSGFLQSPLTLDYSAFQLFADSIQVGYVPDPGSNLTSGVETALKSFPSEKNKYRVIIVLSDGEVTQGEIDQAIDIAKKDDVRIYTIGIATADGDPIPLHSSDGKTMGYKKDIQGEVVITKLNQPLLEKLAKETGGLYFAASPSEIETELIYKHIQTLGKKEFQEKEIIEHEDHFQNFLIVGLILLILESTITERRKAVIQS